MGVTVTLSNQQLGALRKIVAAPPCDDDSEELQALRELLEELEDAGGVEQADSASAPSRHDQAAILERIRRRACEYPLPANAPDTLTLLRDDRAR